MLILIVMLVGFSLRDRWRAILRDDSFVEETFDDEEDDEDLPTCIARRFLAPSKQLSRL